MILRNFSLHHPVAAGSGLLLGALVFRIVDIFVLRLDERWGGGILVSKLAAVAILLGFLWSSGAGLAAAGFHARAIVPSVALGAILTLMAMGLGYFMEIRAMQGPGAEPRIRIGTIDPKSGLAGSAGFASFLLVGNLVNSFAEEGLFRGVLLPMFMREIGAGFALVGSALLFGLWHLPWALKAMFADRDGRGPDLTETVLASFAPQAVLGLVWGYLYLETGNLWGAWVAHPLTNSAVNFVHVRTAGGMDVGLARRMMIYTFVMFLGLVAIWIAGRTLGLRHLQAWRG